MDPAITFAGLVVILFSGLFLAMWYGRRTKKFLWREYAAIVILPCLAVVWAWYRIGPPVVSIYLLTCIGGFALEYALGRAYHVTLGTRLWVYRRYSFGGYTSLMVVPYWGLVGVCSLVLFQFYL